jgi:hypothetical protein
MARKNEQATPHLRVRIEPHLLARLEKAREKSGHTLTGEIVSRLEGSFRRQDYAQLMLMGMSAYRQALNELGIQTSEEVRGREAAFQAGMKLCADLLTRVERPGTDRKPIGLLTPSLIAHDAFKQPLTDEKEDSK